MRRTFALALLAMLALGTQAASQPVVYMIPDIGTPGMNTYVEIIAPVSETGKFRLPDGLASPTQLRIRCINPADTQRLKVSPGVVSWNQRLVSFQFFVPPGSALGPVPIQLDVQGTFFPLDTFFIVAPQAFGARSGGGVIGSSAVYGSGMGQRSKRGAMIVDSMILSGGTYTFDLTDRDPGMQGNQGYLPCIVLSKGRVVVNPGAMISVSAPTGANAKNGGPGGGGGGGYGQDRPAAFPFPDIPGENDTPLGSGFTGGLSDIPIVPSPGGAGSGCGASGAALNGARANNNFSVVGNASVRLFAGGPGHPFDNDGRGGGAAVATGNVPPNILGTYYGGGGNGSKGLGLPPAQDVFNGQVVGNVELVPLHGGGGGASGGANDSVGGGGGGAISIHSALSVSIATIESRGGNGRDGCDNCGPGSGDASAGGAGGSVFVGGRLGVRLTLADVEGGNAGQKAPSAVAASASGNGGGGRFRSDGRMAGAISLVPDISQYAGPTIDTLSYVPQARWSVRGTGRYQPTGGGDSVLVFVRGHNGAWNYDSPFQARVGSDSTWQVDVTFPNDSLAYVCAVQVSPEPEIAGATPYTFVPSHIFSQSAAAIVRISLLQPVLVAPATVRLDTIACPGTVLDTFTVRNTGTGDLIIGTGSRFVLGNATLFQIVQPRLPDTIPPGGSHQWVIRADGATAPNGQLTATLRLLSNDPARPQWDIACSVERRAPAPLVAAPTGLAFGNVQVGVPAQRTIVLTNPPGSVARTVGAVTLVPNTPQLRLVWPTLPPSRTMQPGDTMHVIVEYAPTAAGTLTGVRVAAASIAPCADTLFASVTGRAIRASLLASRSPLLLIDSSCSGRAAAEDTLRLINAGASGISISSLTVTPGPPFTLVPPVPGGVVAPGASVVVRVRYTPGAPGVVAGQLNVVSTDPDRPSFTVDLSGISDTIRVEPSTNLIQFRTLLSCEPSLDTVIILHNRWGDTVRLLPVNIFPPFQLSIIPPYLIPPYDSIAVPISFAPSVNGTFASAMLYTINPCGRIDSVVLRGTRVDASSATTTTVAFGDVTVGGSNSLATTVNNTGPFAVRVIGARIVPATPGLSVNPGQFPITIAAASSAPVALTYAPTAVGSIPAGTTVIVDIDSICTQAPAAVVTGRAIPGGVSLSLSALDFGSLLGCTEAQSTITVRNISAIPVVLSAPALVVGGASGFTLAGGTLVAGVLAPGDSATIGVRFAPGLGPDAALTDTVRIQSSDPLRPVIDIPLSGQRISQASVLAGPAVAPVDAGTTGVTRKWFINTGTSTIIVDAASASAPFAVQSTAPALPAILRPGDSLAVDIAFTPPQPGTFADSLRIVLRNTCDSTVYALGGDGLDPVIAANAAWRNSTGRPGELVRIPLELNTDVAKANVTGYTVVARFNRTLLRPRAVVIAGTLSQGWTLGPTTFQPGRIQFSASGTQPLAGPGTLAVVEYEVMLGDTTETAIVTGDSVTVNSARALFTVLPGVFTLNGLCTVGGPRLLSVSGVPGLKSLRPNPAHGMAQAEIAVAEIGRSRLVLYDGLGRQTVFLDEGLAPGTYIVTLATADLPAGVYYLELQTPSARYRAPLVVAH